MKIIYIISICSLMFICCHTYSLSNKKSFLHQYIKSNTKSDLKSDLKSDKQANKLISSSAEQKIIFLKSNKTISIHRNYYKNNNWRLKYYSDNVFDKSIDIISNEDVIKNQDICRMLFGKKRKKLINITPGGIYGFYDAGISKVIRDNFDLDDCVFSGASAGSWNSLFMVYKHNNHEEVMDRVFDINLHKPGSIKNLQLRLKEKILNHYTTDDFELDKLFVSVCVYSHYSFENYIYTDFTSLEEAIDCCIASSNIPLLTGDFVFRYKDKISFDGGFLSNPHVILLKPVFTINHGIWGKNKFFTSLFNSANTNLKHIYIEGQTDTMDNIDMLNKIFGKTK